MAIPTASTMQSSADPREHSISAMLSHMSAPELSALLARSPERAAPWVRLLALDEVAEAQLCYGRMLLEGTGVPQDRASAFKWFQRAAGQGHVAALNMVGRCLDMGWGTDEDPQAAAVQFGRAAEAGHAWALYNLGHLFLNGRGVPRDRQRAYACYLRAAEQGHPRAMNLVGRCHEEGWGVQRDAAAARPWYERSADAGYFRGQYNWATCLIAMDRPDEALVWLDRAAASGTPPVRAAAAAVAARLRNAMGPTNHDQRRDSRQRPGAGA
jgi:uncharacterized protein